MGIRHNWTQSTQHIPFGKDEHFFSNYKQKTVKNK